MTTRKSAFLLLVMFGGISTIIFGCCGDKGNTAVGNRPAGDRPRPRREVAMKGNRPGRMASSRCQLAFLSIWSNLNVRQTP